jgi:tetratricopeptide (TPR) repeat protein
MSKVRPDYPAKFSGLILCAGLFYCGFSGVLEQQWFEKANTFYQQQKFDSAVSYYEKIMDNGQRSSDLYYNLGNAYFRVRAMGKAIQTWEKAHAIAPDDPDIWANLRFANASIIDRIPQVERSFFEVVVNRLHTLLPLNVQLWTVLLLLFSVSILFAWGLYSTGNGRLWIIYGGTCLSVLTALFGISAGVKIYHVEKVAYAIVLTPACDARNQPDGNKTLFPAHEGTKFLIRKEIDRWALVSLPNGVSGWVELSALGKI